MPLRTRRSTPAAALAAALVFAGAGACSGADPSGVSDRAAASDSPAPSDSKRRAPGAPLAAGSEIDGVAIVVDGDGVEIDGTKIRLFGIDAPEAGQYCRRADEVRWRCGQYSTVELDRRAGGRRLHCEVKDVDVYERPVAICRHDGKDIAAEHVRHGWAVAYRRYSERYVDVEDEARLARRGVWQGSFEKPWDWRRRMRAR